MNLVCYLYTNPHAKSGTDGSRTHVLNRIIGSSSLVFLSYVVVRLLLVPQPRRSQCQRLPRTLRFHSQEPQLPGILQYHCRVFVSPLSIQSKPVRSQKGRPPHPGGNGARYKLDGGSVNPQREVKP